MSFQEIEKQENPLKPENPNILPHSINNAPSPPPPPPRHIRRPSSHADSLQHVDVISDVSRARSSLSKFHWPGAKSGNFARKIPEEGSGEGVDENLVSTRWSVTVSNDFILYDSRARSFRSQPLITQPIEFDPPTLFPPDARDFRGE